MIQDSNERHKEAHSVRTRNSSQALGGLKSEGGSTAHDTDLSGSRKSKVTFAMADLYYQREQPQKLSQFAKVPREALDDILMDEDSLGSKSSELSKSDSNANLTDYVAVY